MRKSVQLIALITVCFGSIFSSCASAPGQVMTNTSGRDTLTEAAQPTTNREIETKRYGLPANARILERRTIDSTVQANRALILWMVDARENPREGTLEENPYTCPEETRGHYLSGRARITLLDTATRQIINTVNVEQQYEGDETPLDTFDLPYLIHGGSYYHVPGANEDTEGQPEIMRLRDYNGDGAAFEFALFDALACSALQTTLIGYSEIQDKIIQYPIQSTIEENSRHTTEFRRWAGRLFSEEPISPGFWQYEVDYRGFDGTLDSYEIRYNRETETFEGRLVRRAEEK